LADAMYKLVSGVKHNGTWKHLKKDGEILYMSIVSYDIDFNEKLSTLVMAND
jgi:hypothetical protein